MANWNPWHGCHKISAGCEHCYVYRMDERHGKETGVVTRLKDFDKVLHKNRKGEYKIASDEIVYTCFTSDFFVEEQMYGEMKHGISCDSAGIYFSL